MKSATDNRNCKKKNVRNNKSCGDARRQREGQGKRERGKVTERMGKARERERGPESFSRLTVADPTTPESPKTKLNKVRPHVQTILFRSVRLFVRPSVDVAVVGVKVQVFHSFIRSTISKQIGTYVQCSPCV